MQPVAVKVKHPGVERQLRADFTVMLALARAAAMLPVLRDLRFDDSCAQFSVPLHQQLDLSLEASNLDRFRHNFRCVPDGAPVPISQKNVFRSIYRVKVLDNLCEWLPKSSSGRHVPWVIARTSAPRRRAVHSSLSPAVN